MDNISTSNTVSDAVKPTSQSPVTVQSMVAKNTFKDHRWLFLVVGVVVLTMLLLYYFLAFGYGRVTIKSDRQNITIKINDKSYNTSSLSLKLKEGKYSVSIEGDNLLTYSQQINVKGGDSISINPSLPSISLVNYVNIDDLYAPKMSPNGNNIYYYNLDKKAFYKIPVYYSKNMSVNGNAEAISDVVNVTSGKELPKIKWSKFGEKALVCGTSKVVLVDFQKNTITNIGNYSAGEFINSSTLLVARNDRGLTSLWRIKLGYASVKAGSINYVVKEMTISPDLKKVALLGSKFNILSLKTNIPIYTTSDNIKSMSWIGSGKIMMDVTSGDKIENKMYSLNLTKVTNLSDIVDSNYTTGDDQLARAIYKDNKISITWTNDIGDEKQVALTDVMNAPQLLMISGQKLIYYNRGNPNRLMALDLE